MFPERLETERLGLERYSHENVQTLSLYGVCSVDEMAAVTRYLPWDPHDTPDETAEFLDGVEARWEDREAV